MTLDEVDRQGASKSEDEDLGLEAFRKYVANHPEDTVEDGAILIFMVACVNGRREAIPVGLYTPDETARLYRISIFNLTTGYVETYPLSDSTLV